MNIFERASRKRIRFPSSVGDLTTEQLWDIPLSARGDKVNLDKLARSVNSELKSLEEGSFVSVIPDARKVDLELKLDILKHVIASKLADQAAAETRAANAERKRKLLAALDSKETAELQGMTREQIMAEIAKI
jgi:hypothetical protein